MPTNSRPTIWEHAQSKGVSRRDFLTACAWMTAMLGLPVSAVAQVTKALETKPRLPVLWFHFQECTCCSESFIRSSHPGVADIILDKISLDYSETLMAGSGKQAEDALRDTMTKYKGEYLMLVEGSVPTADGGIYCCIGGRTALDIVQEAAAGAKALICWGSCASKGCVQAAKPNPTDAAGVSKALGIQTINIAGCPPSPTNFVGTILHYLMFGGIPALDNYGRPVWAYGKRIHDYCERRPHYDAGEFVEQWGDDGAKKAWCLYKVGCKGPYTYANCAKVRFNDGSSWPIMAGHGCIGCTEPAFWDTMTPFEKPISDAGIASALGGGEATVDDIAMVLTGVTVVGVAAHAGLTAYVHRNDGKEETAHKE